MLMKQIDMKGVSREINQDECTFVKYVSKAASDALIKKKIKFSSYIRKFRVEQMQVIYDEGLPNI
jgi:hypothetical protein